MPKIGLIGFGQVAEMAHAPAFKQTPDFTVVAVAEADAGRRAAAAAVFPEAQVFETPAALLAERPDVDVVDIATPPFLHVEQALLGLAAGRHVLCEKPLALSAPDFLRLEHAAREAGRVLFTVHNWKHAPLYVEAAKLIQSGALGKVHHAELHVLRERPASTAQTPPPHPNPLPQGREGVVSNWRTDPKRAGGGITVDHGWHAFYLLTSLLGEVPRGATARLKTGPAGANEEAAVLVDFPSATALIYLTWRASRRENWGVFHGDAGSLEIADDALLLRRGARAPDRIPFPEKLSQGSAHPDWFRAMLEEFRIELDDPRRRGGNLREAAACVALTECCYNKAAAQDPSGLEEVTP